MIAGVEEGLVKNKEGCRETSQKNFTGVHRKDAKSPNSKVQQRI